MSTLSEAFERQLQKLMPQPKATVAPSSGNAGHTTKEIELAYQEGTSDKVYNVQIAIVLGGFKVNFQYGRRGKTLNEGTKTPSKVSQREANSIYQKLVSDKRAKGYEVISEKEK